MDRHASLYELIAAANNRLHTLADENYIRDHLTTCDWCNKRNVRHLQGDFSFSLPAREKIAACDTHTFGHIFEPQVPRDNDLPETIGPLCAVSNIVIDPVIDIGVLRVIGMHLFDGLAARGDIITGPGEGFYQSWILNTWHQTEIPAHYIDPARPDGRLSSPLYALLRKWIRHGPDYTSPFAASDPTTGNADPVVQLRRRLLHDWAPFAADVSRRRELAVQIVDTLTRLLGPTIWEPDPPQGFPRLTMLLYAMVPPDQDDGSMPLRPFGQDQTAYAPSPAMAATAARKEAFDEPSYRAHCRVIAEQAGGKDGQCILLLVAARHFCQTGLSCYADEARHYLAALQ